MHFHFIMYFYLQYFTNMFWPVISPTSGLYFWFKNTDVVKRDKLLHNIKTYNLFLNVLFFNNNVKYYRIRVYNYKMVEVKII
jgi:hypothetical protein